MVFLDSHFDLIDPIVDALWLGGESCETIEFYTKSGKFLGRSMSEPDTAAHKTIMRLCPRGEKSLK